jgi:heterodisulfide reductase subunit A
LRIGIFVCYCGSNIAATVDVEKVAKEVLKFPGVVFAQTNLYTCSDPGQTQIKKAIKEHNLNRVIVASCSPRVHGNTFMRAVETAGLNPYLFEMANIREQDSWIHDDMENATKKAIDLIHMAVAKVNRNRELYPKYFDLNKNVLVIGGGIAGIQAALDIANGGQKVTLVEKEASIGGRMAQLDKTFPTIDCSACILSPKMVDIGMHENIELLTLSEVVKVEGSIGNFKISIKKKPRYVNLKDCTSCGDCEKVCPVKVTNTFETGLSKRTAISKMFTQAVPSAYYIDKRGKAPCASRCPADVPAQGYIALIREKKYLEALKLHRKSNPFPSICGRVCTHPCELSCARSLVDEPVAIMNLKRFIADFEMQLDEIPLPEMKEKKDKKVAIIGAGPAGLTAAYYLAQEGYQVRIIEALPFAGGMLKTGIPDYRLPSDILNREIDLVKRMGVLINTNSRISNADEILKLIRSEGYSAVFLATGAGKNTNVKIQGADLEGVTSGVDFLRDFKLEKIDKVIGNVVVIGGGNAAIDSSRTALRLGAKNVQIFYRRSYEEMPALKEEIEDALEEGIKINYLIAPVEIHGEAGKVKSLKLIKNTLGEPDASGRRRPVPLEGSEFEIAVDMVILAIGQEPDTSYLSIGQNTINLMPDKTVKLENSSMLLVDKAGVFAGGDMVLGPSTVTEAIGQGKLAAKAINSFIEGKNFAEIEADIVKERESEKRLKPEEVFTKEELDQFEKSGRGHVKKIHMDERTNSFKEVIPAFTEEQARHEADRCLNCGICSDCQQCFAACEAHAIDYSHKEETIIREVGAIVAAVGTEIFNTDVFEEYGGGKLEDVISAIQYERLMCASGPTGGHISRPSDKKEPKTVVFLSCVGSRDKSRGMPYCSAACCMYLAKQAILTKEHMPHSNSIIFYTDIRSPGKDYDEFIIRAKEYGTQYVRGKVSKIYKRGDKLIVKGVDTLISKPMEIEADLVVLAPAMIPSHGAKHLAEVLNISTGTFGFYTESHPKLRPVETNTAGIFLAGACQSPKDIPESVAQGSATAAKVLGLMSKDKLLTNPIVASVDKLRCIGCNKCLMVCPFYAIEEFKLKDRKIVQVIESVCKGCGLCEATCPIDAISLNGFTDDMILEELKVLSIF